MIKNAQIDTGQYILSAKFAFLISVESPLWNTFHADVYFKSLLSFLRGYYYAAGAAAVNPFLILRL